MKTKAFVGYLLMPVLVLALFASCQKRGQFEVPCKIAYIVDWQGDTITFTHNAWGDPSKIIQSKPTTGKPNWYFTYDNNHRLTKLFATFGNGGPDGAHDYLIKYKYNSNNFIISDTFFFSGYNDPNNIANWYGYILRTYTYDTQGRVIRRDSKVFGTEYSDTYTYDAQGNLTPGSISYDNKPSFLRTSLVLAFINTNYSQNNPASVATYNSRNLPTSFTPNSTGYTPYFFNQAVSRISYTCDGNSH